MIKYRIDFKELVDYSVRESKKFYKDKIETPNPFYIGFGNPNSEILIIGQEKAIAINDFKKIREESKDNPQQWKTLICEKITDYKYKFSQYENFVNPIHPYKIKAKANGRGQTWFYYQRLISLIYPDNEKSKLANPFFEKCFISELNHKVSKKSLGYQKNLKREKLWSFSFFTNFPIIILAAGSYVEQKDIERLFEVKFSKDLSEPYRKLVVYKSLNTERTLIHTRQLSSGVSDKLLYKIVSQVIS